MHCFDCGKQLDKELDSKIEGTTNNEHVNEGNSNNDYLDFIVKLNRDNEIWDLKNDNINVYEKYIKFNKGLYIYCSECHYCEPLDVC